MITRSARIVVASLPVLAAACDPVSACTCADGVGAANNSEQNGKALMASRLGRAKIVVRGTFVSMRAGEGVTAPLASTLQEGTHVASFTATSRAIATAEFKVRETIKGDVSGTVQVFSHVGLGDCGAGGFFLSAVAMNADLSVELNQISADPPRFTMDTCGYMENHLKNK